MRIKKKYQIMILTIIMSFVITYGISEGNFSNYIFAEILAEDPEETTQILAETIEEPPLWKFNYSTDVREVEYETTIKYNDNKYVDYEKVVQEGSDGMEKFVYQECYADGEFIHRILEEKVYEEPVDEIIEVGTKEIPAAASRGGFRFTNEMDMVATAYDLSYESCGKYPGDPYYGITASGAKAQPGTVAVDPAVIPLGTKLYIASIDGSPDCGYATALDTGSAIKGYRIDLFMEDNQEALNFGIRQVKVYILE